MWTYTLSLLDLPVNCEWKYLVTESCSEFEYLWVTIIVGPDKTMHMINEVLGELFQDK
jgi:hypothetical protein